MARRQAIYKSWDREMLREMYRTRTAREIAKAFGVSESTVRRGLHYYGIRKERAVMQFMEMTMTLYITYKNMKIDISGSIAISKQKYDTIDDKPQYMFAVLYNHIHGQGKAGLQKILAMMASADIIQAGYSEKPASEQHSFVFKRFIINGINYTAQRNANLYSNEVVK